MKEWFQKKSPSASARRIGTWLLGKIDRPFIGVGLPAEEERSMSHGANKYATALVSDLFAKKGALVPIGA